MVTSGLCRDDLVSFLQRKYVCVSKTVAYITGQEIPAIG